MLAAATDRAVVAAGAGTGTGVGAALLASGAPLTAKAIGDAAAIVPPGSRWGTYAAQWRARTTAKGI
jgi:hypothetical protein